MERRKRTDRLLWWQKRGMSARQERLFRWSTVALISLMSGGWLYALYDVDSTPAQVFTAAKYNKNGKVVQVLSSPQMPVAPATSSLASAMLDQPSTAAFIDDAAIAFLEPLRGESGKLHVAMRTPGSSVADEEGGMQARYERDGETLVSSDFSAPDQPGIYSLAVQLNQATRQLQDLSLITLVPFSSKHGGRIGNYQLGSWPFEQGGTPKSASYSNPSGFIEVTAENRNLEVSDHFKLGDFLTKNQPNVWPKYLLLQPRLLDKLELIIAEMKEAGVRVDHVHVMSGFRTPSYNATGGNTAGRANLSRHMYGDASDIYVDNNQDGYPDDLNGDGRVDVRDAEFLAAFAERVERKYPSLVGGVGVYTACCGHGPFTHVDVRGSRARWRGTGNG